MYFFDEDCTEHVFSNLDRMELGVNFSKFSVTLITKFILLLEISKERKKQG